MWTVVVGCGSLVHHFIGFYGLDNAVFLIGPIAKATAVKWCHIDFGLTVHHPLRHKLTDTALGDTDTRSTEVPEVTQPSLWTSEYIVIRCMRDRTIDDGLYPYFFKPGSLLEATL